MGAFLILLALLAIGCLLSGPIALIKVLGLSSKIDRLYRKSREREIPTQEPPFASTEQVLNEFLTAREEHKEQVKPSLDFREQPVEEVKSEPVPPPIKVPEVDFSKEEETATVSSASEENIRTKKKLLLEQQIGTKWILIAGVITVIVGVGFFLKYAYDNFSLGPLGRTIAVTVSGLVALTAGEITRRRGYDFVAKGVTALGFAILYAAIFTAYQLYGLIGFVPAFILSIAVTAIAMLYAVVLNEIIIAFLSLLGGFLTPLIVLSKIESPTPLFIYVLILSIGAMLCAYYRKWRAVNLLSFIGTFLLYSIWFHHAGYWSAIMYEQSLDAKQIFFTLGWVSVFFLIYLVMQILYELINKVNAHREDVLLILINSVISFFYFYIVLFNSHRDALAGSAIAFSVIHLATRAIVCKRCQDDTKLKIALLVIGLFYMTIAIPLYLKMYAVSVVWAAESVVLVVIGLRYRSRLTQFGGAVAFILSCGNLVYYLPMHTDEFKLVWNPVFGTWLFVAAAACLSHLVYKKASELNEEFKETIVQIFYAAMGFVLFAAATMEWYWHCHYNIDTETWIHYISQGQLVIFAAIVMIFALRPICPRGKICEALSFLMAGVGAIFTLVALVDLHTDDFIIFANVDFVMVLVFISAILFCHMKYRRMTTGDEKRNALISQILYAAMGFLLFAAATMEWLWHCHYNLEAGTSIQYISRGQLVILAAIVLFFALRPLCPRGKLCDILSSIMLAAGSIFTLVALANLHNDGFIIFANIDFIMVLVFISAMLICHVKYRQMTAGDEERNEFISQIIYGTLGALFLFAISAEWYWHCEYNLLAIGASASLLKGQVLIIAMVMLLFVIRPVCPKGIVSMILAAVLAGFGALFTLTTFWKFYEDNFTIFANTGFVIALCFVAALFAAGWFLLKTNEDKQNSRQFSAAFVLAGIFMLWILLAEEIYLYWYCLDLFDQPLPNWEFLAHMYISVMWAVYAAALIVIGFWKKLRLYRYLAIAMFGLLLVKVFVLDTRTIENVYRIAAFLATGVTLVGISYLYQYLKKKNFFDSMLNDKSQNQQ